MEEQNWEGGQEVQSNWFKFVNIGDKIRGTLLNKYFAKASIEGYQDQWVYELQVSNGEIWNVAVAANKSGTIQRLNRCRLGEIIGVVFDKEIPSSSKGKQPAKALSVYTFGMDPAYQIAAEMDGEVVPS